MAAPGWGSSRYKEFRPILHWPRWYATVFSHRAPGIALEPSLEPRKSHKHIVVLRRGARYETQSLVASQPTNMRYVWPRCRIAKAQGRGFDSRAIHRLRDWPPTPESRIFKTAAVAIL